MKKKNPIRIKTITEAHRLSGLRAPEHPLINIIDFGKLKEVPGTSVILEFYAISLKRSCEKIQYGQQKHDFDNGVMSFFAPNQVLQGPENTSNPIASGWMLFVHPDLLLGTALLRKMKQYEFFGYAVNEALFLSEKEETVINGIIENIRHEYQSNIDKFSQDVIIAQLDLLLTYAQRFYERQFITRKVTNKKVLTRLEDLLTTYFNNDELLSKGLPTVQYIANQLHISTKYLGSLLKELTGQTAQQHIHNKLIEKAKERLSTTDLSVSEIAYELGFGHPQSFSKLFKAKTNVSPLEFRDSFN